MLKLGLTEGPHVETLRRVNEQVMRVAKIVSDLRSFTERERERGGLPFSLNQPVRRAAERQEAASRAKGLSLMVRTSPEALPVQGDAAQVEQLVTQLLQNAIEATPPGGEVTVLTERFEGELARLVVSDTGRGIPALLRERIFDPFFTTKTGASGVGLGLSVAASIVHAHHGSIRVESEETRGTRFTITLPTLAAAHLA
jgi:signal transduction histidine kinase